MDACSRAASSERPRALVYSHPMATAAIPVKPRGLALILAWRRVRFVLIVSLMFGLLFKLGNSSPLLIVLARAAMMGMALLFMFGLFEQWPKQLWPWLSRWGLQLIGIVVIIPFAAFFAYWITTGGDPQLDHNK